MGWSALFDHTHIVKGVPVDAEIELQCSIAAPAFAPPMPTMQSIQKQLGNGSLKIEMILEVYT